jgi:hypothetical protein
VWRGKGGGGYRDATSLMDHKRAKIRSSLMSPRKEFSDIKCAVILSETRGDILIYSIIDISMM